MESMDSRFARDNLRRAVVVNRGLLPSAPPMAPPMAPTSPSATVMAATRYRFATQHPEHHLGWQGLRLRDPVLVLRGDSRTSPSTANSPGCSTSPMSSPKRPPSLPPALASPSSSASSPVPVPPLPFPQGLGPLGPFCPGQGLERASAFPIPGRSQSEAPWLWRSDGRDGDRDRQGQLPSFGARTAAASIASTSPEGSSLASAALSSSPPSPPHTLTGPDHLLTDSSNIDEFTAIALTQLHEACGRLQLEEASGGPMQAHSFNDGDQSHLVQQVFLAPSHYLQSSKPPRKKNGHQRSSMFCAFCKGNGELPRTYTSHSLHTELPDGRVIVTCEVLRSLKCELCGASGDVAHTRSHCPFNRKPSVAVLLKNTPRRCDGSLRKKK